MYSKQEASQLKHQFWTSFGIYMRPVPSATGKKVNWINYKTGIRHISLRMNAESDRADFSIEISSPDDTSRHTIFTAFISLKKEFDESVPGNWLWERSAYNDSGKKVSRISLTNPGLNIYCKDDWPAIISFLKHCITGVDHFWAKHKDIFEML